MSTLPQEEPLPTISIREFLERILEERDRLYNIRFEEAKTAVNAALIAQKEAVTSAFAASEKAIIKAEDAQREYNARSNEFRGQLDDQAKTLMPRPETLALFTAMDEKLVIIQSSYDNKIEALRTSFEKTSDGTTSSLAEIRIAMTHLLAVDAYETRHTELQRQVNDLRESRSEAGGKSSGANALWGYLVAIAGIVLALVFHFVK